VLVGVTCNERVQMRGRRGGGGGGVVVVGGSKDGVYDGKFMFFLGGGGRTILCVSCVCKGQGTTETREPSGAIYGAAAEPGGGGWVSA
jgi:hypothetical protein